MFCTQCANEVEAHAKFCSKCGSPVLQDQAQTRPRHDMNKHMTVLAWIYIGGAGLMGITGIIALIASQVIRRVPIPLPPDAPPEILPLIGTLVLFGGFLNLLLSVGVAAAGIGLLQYRNWGRVCAVIMAATLAFWFPVGTALAVYTFWVLFSEAGRDHFRARAAEQPSIVRG